MATTLIEHLTAEGATVIGCDLDMQKVEAIAKSHKIETIRPEAVYDVECDVFAPCALGAIVNKDTIPRIKAKIIAGAANNQLATPEDGMELLNKKVLYAPDYAINAGGLINIYFETQPGGYNRQAAFDYVARIEATLGNIFVRSKNEGIPTHVVADQIAEERIAKRQKIALQ